MQLSAVRAKVAAITGRYDLVTDAGADNGMDYYINAAQRWLDLRHPAAKLKGRHLANLALADTTLTIRYLRSIEKVQVIDPDTDERHFLDPVDLYELHTLYAEGMEEIDAGTPDMYALSVIGLAPNQLDLADISAFHGTEGMMVGDSYQYDGLIWYPPSDKLYTMQVWGEFYSVPLVADTDFSMWSTNWSYQLVAATAMLLEEGMGIDARVGRWYQMLEADIEKLQMDDVQQEIGEGPIVIWG